jgi:hypothetical protein
MHKIINRNLSQINKNETAMEKKMIVHAVKSLSSLMKIENIVNGEKIFS